MVCVRMSSPVVEKPVASLAELNQLSKAELIEAITAGLPAALVWELARRMEMTIQEMAGLLRLNPRTLQRRLDSGLLSLSESERLWELWHLIFRAIEVLESEPAAVHWFKNPIQALGGVAPRA